MNKARFFFATAILAALVIAALQFRGPREQVAPTEQATTEHLAAHDDVASTQPTADGQEHHVHETEANEAPHQEAVQDFQQWLTTDRPQANDEAIALAKQRRERMRWLMKNDPEQAIAEAVSYAEYERVPQSMRAYVEEPFSEVAELMVLPVCNLDHDHDAHHEHPAASYVLKMNGESYSAGVYGRRLSIDTKEGTSLQGIVLDGLAAIREEVMQPLSPEDVAALASLPLLNPDPQRGFATGKQLGDDYITAMAGDRLARFISPEALASFNQKLATLDTYPGPNSSAEVAFNMPYPADGEDGFDFTAAEQQVILLADNWTETVKKVFFIRVDFPDQTGESVSQAVLEQKLNNETSPNIYDMSLGKTYLDADVSSQVVRLPSTTSTYLNEPDPGTTENDLLHDDAVAAFNALSTGIDLGDYDIIGVHFTSIGMKSGGLNYSGLASRGGSNQWLQGTTNVETIVHEFGHNYGLQHARHWNTTDGSVVGTGVSVEYGDISDILGSGPYPNGFFHGQARARLNWFESGINWEDASANGSGTYRIYQLDDGATTQPLRSVRVTRAANEYFWIGYRRNLDNNFFDHGAYLVWQRSGENSGWLMDATPDSEGTTTADSEDSPLLLGRTFSDSDVHITPVAQGGESPDEWLDVHIEFGPFPGNSAPTASITGPSTVNAREPATFIVDATDANGDTLAYYWEMDDSVIQPNSSSLTYIWPSDGTFEIEVVVSDRKGGTVTATKTVTVSDTLNNWNARSSGTPADLYDICEGDNGRLVAVGKNTDDLSPNYLNGVYRYSDDGVSWNGGDFGLNDKLNAVIWDGSKYVAVGRDWNGSAWLGVIYTSTDGSSWTQRYFAGEELWDVAYNGSIYVAAGELGTYATSADGINWTGQSIGGVSEDFRGIDFGNGVFVMVGGDSGLDPIVLTSADGSSWVDESAGVGTPQALYKIQYCDDLFLASGFYARLRTSTNNGQTFTSNRANREQMEALTFGNDLFFASGIDKDDADSPVTVISTDGENWTEITTPAVNYINAAVFYDDTFIMVGDGGEIWQTDTFTGLTLDPLTEWQLTYFPSIVGDGAPDNDYENDGLPNLYEYFTGGDPTQPSRGLLPVLTWDNGFTFTLPEDTEASGVSLNVLKSTDLINWSAATYTDVSVTPGEVILDITDAPSAGNPLFLQVEVVED